VMLAHVDIVSKEIAIYDSLYNKPTQLEYSKKLCDLLAAAPGLENTNWQTRQTADFPQQNTKSDSGLFTCAAALCIGTNKSMIFSQTHMENFRLALADSLLRDSTRTNHTTALKSIPPLPSSTNPKSPPPTPNEKPQTKPTTSPPTPTELHKPTAPKSLASPQPPTTDPPKPSTTIIPSKLPPKTNQTQQQVPQLPQKAATTISTNPTTPKPATAAHPTDYTQPAAKLSPKPTPQTTPKVPTFFQIGYKPNPPTHPKKRKKKLPSTISCKHSTPPAKPTPKKRSRSGNTMPGIQEQDKTTPPAKRQRRRRPENSDAPT